LSHNLVDIVMTVGCPVMRLTYVNEHHVTNFTAKGTQHCAALKQQRLMPCSIHDVSSALLSETNETVIRLQSARRKKANATLADSPAVR